MPRGYIMTEALFGIIGVLIGAGVSYFAQLRATRLAIEGQLKRLAVETKIRETEKKSDLIREWVAEILTECDPDINKQIDYRKIVMNIHRLQLILDTSNNQSHKALNNAINNLGLSFQTKNATRKSTYQFQSQIVEAVKAMNKI
jgi:DNA-binding FadR family transcriptional regulator